ncbi:MULTISPECIES: DUF6644 family protein [Methylomonas]|uniref:DUF6644 domain-containing protein n=1 Tax=Methylomonas koyamae TaxID=702114 RepID=A0A177NJS5_9GAMM|nr:DUF6644 family protein [Methylomonas koyamae]OAI17814.1 hypothetical protein A1355_06960 [Methylomonas koyamae]
MTLLEFSQLLYDSEFGTALRESVYLFPLIEGLHLIGLAVSIGLLFFVDLRLLGWFLPQLPVVQLLHSLRPWLLGGFAVTFVSGLLLFVATASKIVVLPVFFYKLGFIALAGLNALWFERRWGRDVVVWGNAEVPPSPVRFAGAASLTLWSLVVIAGRLIPYLSYQ